jgi:hypothetical protein
MTSMGDLQGSIEISLLSDTHGHAVFWGICKDRSRYHYSATCMVMRFSAENLWDVRCPCFYNHLWTVQCSTRPFCTQCTIRFVMAAFAVTCMSSEFMKLVSHHKCLVVLQGVQQNHDQKFSSQYIKQLPSHLMSASPSQINLPSGVATTKGKATTNKTTRKNTDKS